MQTLTAKYRISTPKRNLSDADRVVVGCNLKPGGNIYAKCTGLESVTRNKMHHFRMHTLYRVIAQDI